LPLFTPRGTILRDIVAQYSNQLRQKFGFEKVWTPHITKKDLYETSGHWAKFGEELFLVKSQETSDEMALKPMNCPHHTQIFASRPRSYRDMPVRYLETTTDYRDEKTGELGGLNRVRSLTQDDSHIFCRTDQIEEEINNLLSAARELYGSIDMKLRVRLSYRDKSDSYLGDLSLWDSAQNQLKSAVEKVGLDYFEQEGEAAFYGPKIDFMATDAIGREHQVATVQLDFVQPQRFGLEYADADGNFTTPVMIHCALLGSIERFLSVFIEHTGGWFPFWAAPEQVRILTINDTVLEYVDKTMWVVLVITMGCAFGLSGVSATFAPVYWGEEFRASSQIIAGMTPALVFSAFGNVIRTQFLIPRSFDKEYTVSLLYGAIVNILINILLIPKIGAMGAVIGTIVAELVLCCYQTWIARNYLHIREYLINAGILFLIGSVMYMVLILISSILPISLLTLIIEIIFFPVTFNFFNPATAKIPEFSATILCFSTKTKNAAINS